MAATSSAMTGSSLWLVPPESSDLYRAIWSLINQELPSYFAPTDCALFTPHVTLTADTISRASTKRDLQQHLDSLKLSNLKISIRKLDVGTIFFQKLTMNCDKMPEVLNLAVRCRTIGTGDENEAKLWVDKNYRPHCSLMYSNLPPKEVEPEVGVLYDMIQQAKSDFPESGTATGGSIWLVPTYKDVSEWRPVATWPVPEMKWSWETKK